jgi:hypothetical protein
MQKIIRLSRPLQWLCQALMILLPASLILFWIVVTPVNEDPGPLVNSGKTHATAAIADYIPGTGYIPGMAAWGTEINIHNQRITTIGDFNLKLRFAPPGPTQKLVPWQRVGAGLLSALNLSFTILILFYLSQLFSWYSKGDIFSKKHTLCFKHIALTLIAAQFCKPILEGGIRLILTWFNSTGRFITMSFDNVNIVALFSGVIILLIAMIMEEGYKINQEIQLTV